MRYFYALTVEGADAPEDNFAKRLLRTKESDELSQEEVATLTANLLGGVSSFEMYIFLLKKHGLPRVWTR